MVNLDPIDAAELIKKGIVICRTKDKNHPFGIFYGQNPLYYAFPLLLIEVSSFLIISRFVHFLLKPLRQPKVVSGILGGIILGPSVLSRSGKFRAYMYPDNADYVIRNLGVIGFMYFLFISGVKMDIMVVKKLGKKHWYIALVGVLVPLSSSITIAFLERKSLDKRISNLSSIWGICSSLAITAFPVLYPIVRELNLLSSEIGRMALSTAVVSDVIGMNGVLIFEASKQGENRPIAALWFMISFIVVVSSVFIGVRQAMLWIVRTTPEGKQVDQIYVIAILLGVMVIGFIADMFGLAIANGPLWLGLAVPDGPPLGAILVEKSETILTNFLMPLSFIYVGMITDVSSMSGHWSNLQPLFFMVLGGYSIKMIATLAASRFFDLSTRDSLTLSLIMSLRGEVEFILFMHWMDFEMIDQPQFTVLVLMSVSVTAFATPLISILYDPTRPYMVNTRRNIQHNPPNNELNIVVCIHGEENMTGFMKLLEVSNPSINSPFSVYALLLVELIGRANPIFIDHENEENGVEQSKVHNALKIFQETRGEYIKIHFYTTIAPKKSMYQDICDLALSKKASLIILPYNNNNLNGGKQRSKSMNSNVLEHAPCSVGILLDKSPYQNLACGVSARSMHHFVVLFLGGSDAREALTYADRMASNPDISLTVFRFLSCDNVGDNVMEKKLDDGLVTWFWVKNEGNSRIVYREVVVKNGEETIAAIQAMNNECYDLWIVGRKNGINPVLLEGLSNWGDNNELGVIGDFVASVDFGSRASVLAVQQQILRGQENSSGSLLGRFCFCT
ncbi:hypothetical protein ACJIZ3_012446 [Penstemon smallii]|uniref:Cation/H+ exchanger domain-containing protein n=1 Tax=Penstemon smallii TaxID=265156 RepID=A0ABD3UM28_9LAMI